MSKVIWTVEASVSLESQRLYLSEINPALADRAVQKIIATCESLSNFPTRGAPIKGTPGLRKFIGFLWESAFCDSLCGVG
jgi:plasmid stabilization system protein ParE